VTTRSPVFIVSTEGKSPEQMKAAARRALSRFWQASAESGRPVDDEMYPFAAEFDGHEPRRFVTLQQAMTYAETLDRPTGAIRCLGVAMMLYHDGIVDFAAAFHDQVRPLGMGDDQGF
jgi:hypothetical protein